MNDQNDLIPAPNMSTGETHFSIYGSCNNLSPWKNSHNFIPWIVNVQSGKTLELIRRLRVAKHIPG